MMKIPLRLRQVHELHTVGREELPRPRRRFAARVRLERISTAIAVQRPGPGLEGNIAEFRSIRELFQRFCVRVIPEDETLVDSAEGKPQAELSRSGAHVDSSIRPSRSRLCWSVSLTRPDFNG